MTAFALWRGGGGVSDRRSRNRTEAPHLRTVTGAVATGLLAFAVAGCASTPWEGTEADPVNVTFAEELGIDLSQMTRTESGLYYRDLAPGMGAVARRNSLVTIHYATWLSDGTLMDTSVGADPFTFRLGGNEVIRGWNENIPGMKVGGRRKMVVRPGLAYGRGGRGRIPPNTTLVFEVQLVDVR